MAKPIDHRRLVLRRLKELDRTKYWLGTQMEDAGVCTRLTVTRWLDGHTSPSVDIFVQVLHTLGLTIRPK